MYGLRASGTRHDLIRTILSNDMPGLNFVLLRSCNKDEVRDIARKMELKTSGTRDDLKERILSSIEWSDRYISNHDIIEFDNSGRLRLRYVDCAYVLETFFDKSQLHALCRKNRLQLSGSRDALIERLVSARLQLSDLLGELEFEDLEELINRLEIAEDYSDEDDAIELIQAKLQSKSAKKHSLPSKAQKTKTAYQYDVAISFAGEDRRKAEAIVREMQSIGIRVFYDQDEVENTWGSNLVEYLQRIYRDSAEYCVILISEHYLRKYWTNHEANSALERQLSERSGYILPVKIDNSDIPGLPKTVGYISHNQYSPKQIAGFVKNKIGR